MAENLANDFATTLAGAVDNSTGTLTVVLASGAPAPNFRIRVDDELMLVTAVAGTTWTATRGIEGTAAASHASGAVAAHVLTAGALAALFADHVPAAPTHLTTNTTLASNSKYSYSAGALTLTLPAAPANGDEVVIYNTGSLLTTVVGRNGKTIMGLAQDINLDMPNKKFVFEYLSASGDWRLS